MTSAIGIDIGGTNTRVALVSSAGKILRHVSAATKREAKSAYAEMVANIKALAASDTRAIGIGIPSRVDSVSGRIYPGGYVDLSGLALAEQIKRDTGLAMFADNDGSMALLAEARIGAARRHQHAIMLTIGTGIGGSILSDGRIFHGGGLAGQLGHITLDVNGKLCKCGRTGCFETECSGTALAGHIAAAGFPPETRFEQLLQDKSPAARTVVDSWGKNLRAGIDSLVAAFGPPLIILGGGLGAAALQAVNRTQAMSSWFQYEVVGAELGDEAGVVGAALAGLEHTS